MNLLEFTVTGNHLTISTEPVSTGGSVNYDKCSFEFDSEWDGFEKTAVFGMGRDTYRVALDENDSCFIPSPCMENEGIITVGVFGTNDDTVIASNAVAHHVEEGISDLGDWFEEDYSLVLRAVSNMESRVGDCLRELNENFENVMTQIRRNVVITPESISAESPDDWYVPNEFIDAEDLENVIGDGNVQSLLNYRFDSLCRDFPYYVSREKLGNDESGEYPVYAYKFTPSHYEKTIIVTGATHGTDAKITVGLSNFFNELCRHNKGDRILSYLKNAVKFVVIPVVNPYGVANGMLYNSNEVDIGYNFPYRWMDCPMENKGSIQSDQAETRLLTDYAELLHTDRLSAAVDFRIGTKAVAGKSIYYPRFKNNCINALSEFVNKFNYEIESGTKTKSILAPSILSTFTNYLADEYGINTCEAVWSDEVYGDGNDGYTKLTEFIGNLLYVMAKNSSFICKCGSEPFVKYFTWIGDCDEFVIPDVNPPIRMGMTNYRFSLDAPCILNMQGYVVVDVRESCTLTVNPILWQENSPEQTYNDRASMVTFRHKYDFEPGTHVIPISSVLQAYATSYNHSEDTAFCGDVCFSLAFSVLDASSAEVKAFTAVLTGIPSNLGRSVEVIKPYGESVDFGPTDFPTQRILFPKETVVTQDSKFDD